MPTRCKQAEICTQVLAHMTVNGSKTWQTKMMAKKKLLIQTWRTSYVEVSYLIVVCYTQFIQQ